MGMHHDQDMRNMGGLRKYMPITWMTSLLGSLALIGTPFFSGFYSKDSIIEAVQLSHLPAAGFAYFAVIAGVFVTAFYSFRMYFLVFHGKERWMEKKTTITMVMTITTIIMVWVRTTSRMSRRGW
jgi:NADH-quinone oxidoreductase subunit L